MKSNRGTGIFAKVEGFPSRIPISKAYQYKMMVKSTYEDVKSFAQGYHTSIRRVFDNRARMFNAV